MAFWLKSKLGRPSCEKQTYLVFRVIWWLLLYFSPLPRILLRIQTAVWSSFHHGSHTQSKPEDPIDELYSSWGHCLCCHSEARHS